MVTEYCQTSLMDMLLSNQFDPGRSGEVKMTLITLITHISLSNPLYVCVCVDAILDMYIYMI